MSQSRHSRRNTRGEISSQKSETASLHEAEDESKTGALIVLKRGLQVSPELRTGASLTVLMALIVAAGSLAIPVLTEFLKLTASENKDLSSTCLTFSTLQLYQLPLSLLSSVVFNDQTVANNAGVFN